MEEFIQNTTNRIKEAELMLALTQNPKTREILVKNIEDLELLRTVLVDIHAKYSNCH